MASIDQVENAFRAFIGDPTFPCLGAKSTLHNERHTIGVYGSLGQGDSDRLLADICPFVERASADQRGFATFVAVFPDDAPRDEHEFEQRLWQQLQHLHDSARGSKGDDDWDASVSSDPEDPHFAFSIAGHAFFVVGLHPHSSRLARRFDWPALAFNPHAQFARLRAEGRYIKLRDAIRQRDLDLQGSLNPNLADFGERSDARQYSGRAIEADWRCPFHRSEP